MRNLSTLTVALLATISATSLAGCEHKSKASDEAKATSSVAPKSAAGQAAAGIADSKGTPTPADKKEPTPGGDPVPDAPGKVRAPVAADLEVYLKAIPGKGSKLIADIETSMGTLTCELFAKQRPITVANFIGLATGQHPWLNPKTNEVETNRPYFDGLNFHRVIPGFMIQGGDPLGSGRGGPGYQFVDEFGDGLSNVPGTLAMANAGPTTNGSQFFINEGNNKNLDPKHTVFGQCTPMKLITEITNVPTQRERPITPVTLDKVVVHFGD